MTAHVRLIKNSGLKGQIRENLGANIHPVVLKRPEIMHRNRDTLMEGQDFDAESMQINSNHSVEKVTQTHSGSLHLISHLPDIIWDSRLGMAAENEVTVMFAVVGFEISQSLVLGLYLTDFCREFVIAIRVILV